MDPSDGRTDALEQELRGLQSATRNLRRWALVLGVVVVLGALALLVVASQARYVD